MFTLYEYYDKNRLAETIRNCRGNVLLTLEDGTVINLKEDHTALRLLLQTGIGKNGLTVRLSDQTDLVSFIWLSLQAA